MFKWLKGKNGDCAKRGKSSPKIIVDNEKIKVEPTIDRGPKIVMEDYRMVITSPNSVKQLDDEVVGPVYYL
jgi:hypothetical protein